MVSTTASQCRSRSPCWSQSLRSTVASLVGARTVAVRRPRIWNGFPNRLGLIYRAERAAPCGDHYHLARPRPTAGAQTSRIREGSSSFPGRSQCSTTPSTSSTRRCATAPSARASPTRSPTSSPSPGCSTSSASGSSRAAGPARCPRTPSSSPGPRPASSTLRHAQLVAFGATRKAGAAGGRRPAGAGAARLAGARSSRLVAKSDVRHVERALRTTLEENLAMVADTVGFLRGRGPAGVPRLRALLRRLRRTTATTALRVLEAAFDRRAPTSACCATPTAACCRWASPGSSPR